MVLNTNNNHKKQSPHDIQNNIIDNGISPCLLYEKNGYRTATTTADSAYVSSPESSQVDSCFKNNVLDIATEPYYRSSEGFDLLKNTLGSDYVSFEELNKYPQNVEMIMKSLPSKTLELPLSSPLQELFLFFRQFEFVVDFTRRSQASCLFYRDAKPQVERITKRRFTLETLRRLAWMGHSFLSLKYVAAGVGKEDIRIFRLNQGQGTPGEKEERLKIFKSALIRWQGKRHGEFIVQNRIRGGAPCPPIERLTEWHPAFFVDDPTEPPMAQIQQADPPSPARSVSPVSRRGRSLTPSNAERSALARLRCSNSPVKSPVKKNINTTTHNTSSSPLSRTPVIIRESMTSVQRQNNNITSSNSFSSQYNINISSPLKRCFDDDGLDSNKHRRLTTPLKASSRFPLSQGGLNTPVQPLSDNSDDQDEVDDLLGYIGTPVANKSKTNTSAFDNPMQKKNVKPVFTPIRETNNVSENSKKHQASPITPAATHRRMYGHSTPIKGGRDPKDAVKEAEEFENDFFDENDDDQHNNNNNNNNNSNTNNSNNTSTTTTTSPIIIEPTKNSSSVMMMKGFIKQEKSTIRNVNVKKSVHNSPELARTNRKDSLSLSHSSSSTSALESWKVTKFDSKGKGTQRIKGTNSKVDNNYSNNTVEDYAHRWADDEEASLLQDIDEKTDLQNINDLTPFGKSIKKLTPGMLRLLEKTQQTERTQRTVAQLNQQDDSHRQSLAYWIHIKTILQRFETKYSGASQITVRVACILLKPFRTIFLQIPLTAAKMAAHYQEPADAVEAITNAIFTLGEMFPNIVRIRKSYVKSKVKCFEFNNFADCTSAYAELDRKIQEAEESLHKFHDARQSAFEELNTFLDGEGGVEKEEEEEEEEEEEKEEEREKEEEEIEAQINKLKQSNSDNISSRRSSIQKLSPTYFEEENTQNTQAFKKTAEKRQKPPPLIIDPVYDQPQEPIKTTTKTNKKSLRKKPESTGPLRRSSRVR